MCDGLDFDKEVVLLLSSRDVDCFEPKAINKSGGCCVILLLGPRGTDVCLFLSIFLNCIYNDIKLGRFT